MFICLYLSAGLLWNILWDGSSCWAELGAQVRTIFMSPFSVPGDFQKLHVKLCFCAVGLRNDHDAQNGELRIGDEVH